MEDNDAALYEIFNAGIVRCNLRCKESLNEVWLSKKMHTDFSFELYLSYFDRTIYSSLLI